MQVPSEHLMGFSDGHVFIGGQLVRVRAQVPSPHLIGVAGGQVFLFVQFN